MTTAQIITTDSTRLEPFFGDELVPIPVKKVVLLIKPYQKTDYMVHSPPLGLLYLASGLRRKFGDMVDVHVVDMKLQYQEPEKVHALLERYQPDVVGLSALNFEYESSNLISDYAKKFNPDIVTALGGPLALHRSEELLGKTSFDWVVSGAADRSFPEALARVFLGEDLGNDLPGLAYRGKEGALTISDKEDNLKDLNSVAMPAWDLVDFDAYAKVTAFAMLKGKRYATLFTSRGCPYKCNYCHDIFSKRFVARDADSVIEEIALLYETYGVNDFQIVDDIFNLHKPRLKAIMDEVHRRWPGQLNFSFPNGVRADILDDEVLDALAKGGTWLMSIAVETVTPRLQDLIEKYLDVDKAFWAINAAEDRGITVGGFFMLGFPTESVEEMKATIDFALKSKLSYASFFTVTPQPETPLYPLAEQESPDALRLIGEAEERGEGGNYNTTSWYEAAYGYPLDRLRRQATFRFYANPVRIYKLIKAMPLRSFIISVKRFLQVMTPGRKSTQDSAVVTPGEFGA